MKKPRNSESQIFQILKEAEAGIPVPELCRNHGMSSASFYKWRLAARTLARHRTTLVIRGQKTGIRHQKISAKEALKYH